MLEDMSYADFISFWTNTIESQIILRFCSRHLATWPLSVFIILPRWQCVYPQVKSWCVAGMRGTSTSFPPVAGSLTIQTRTTRSTQCMTRKRNEYIFQVACQHSVASINTLPSLLITFVDIIAVLTTLAVSSVYKEYYIFYRKIKTFSCPVITLHSK